MKWFFYAVYNYVAWPLAKLLAQLAALTSEKAALAVAMRKDVDGQAPWLKSARNQRPVWIHCASGEFEYAKPVIQLLKEQRPNCKIMVTYFSPSVARTVSSFPDIDFSCPLPWDTSRAMREFMLYHSPRCLLIARTDTWPEMLRQAKAFEIPCLLFSATLTSASGRTQGFGRWTSREVFSYLTEIFAVSDADATEFRQLTPSVPVQVRGDTRYDQVQNRVGSPKPTKRQLFDHLNTGFFTLVAGSTWHEDEAALLEAMDRLRETLAHERGLELIWVFVPHEPTAEHVENMLLSLIQRGLKPVRYSDAEAALSPDTPLVVDCVGILAELYLYADFAFVGGSFRKSVHSVMEPLAAGCVTFVGPLYHNNREAEEFAKLTAIQGPRGGITMVQPVANGQRMAELLADLIHTLRKSDAGSSGSAVTLSQSVQRNIKSQVARRSGKSHDVVTWVVHHAKL